MKKIVKILKALANEKRLEILNLLSRNPGLSLAEISQEIDLHFKSTSKHLQRLTEARLLQRKKSGLFVRFGPTRKINELLKKVRSL